MSYQLNNFNGTELPCMFNGGLFPLTKNDSSVFRSQELLLKLSIIILKS